jgi:hypothetical protein
VSASAEPIESSSTPGASVRDHAEPRAPGPDRREHRGRKADLADQILGPDAALQIEGQRARGEREIRAGHAGQAPGQVVRDVQPGAGAGKGLGMVRFEPEQLAKGEDRVGGEAGQRVQPLPADFGLQPGELRLRPLVVPGDRPTGRLAVRIEGDERLADARHGQT